VTGREEKRRPNPSPLVGEGGSRASREPGEGASPAVAKARSLRRKMTDAEKKLWYVLRDRRFKDAKFRRQVPLGRYVADFLSFEKKVVVELDGAQHAESKTDVKRDNWFSSQGFRVLRFWNNDVLTNIEGVYDRLSSVVGGNRPHPSPKPQAASAPPSPARGEGMVPDDAFETHAAPKNVSH